jgi:hypothetical protein
MRKRRNPFIHITVGSIFALALMIAIFRMFLKIFGDLALSALPTFQAVMFVPMLSLVIGVVGWLYWTTRPS